jgi:hypothetical protein
MIVQRDARMGRTPPLPPLQPAPPPSASDAAWAAFRAAGQARRRAIARHVLAQALAMPTPELRQWDGTPYPDLAADPAFEPWPAEREPHDRSLASRSHRRRESQP